MAPRAKPLQSVPVTPSKLVDSYSAAAQSKATQCTYSSDVQHFKQHGGTIPATPTVVAEYLASIAGAYAVATLQHRLIAIHRALSVWPFDKTSYIGCGVKTGVGAMVFSAKVEAGANVVVSGHVGIGGNVIQGTKMVGADKIIGVDINPGRIEMARKFGLTHFINPKEVENVVDRVVQLTDGGADFSFECMGNVTTMREVLECCHKGAEPVFSRETVLQ